MQLERLIAALGPTEVIGGAPVEISELAYDAREVPPGALFFCISGDRVDGHEFAPQAVEAGAVALVVERPLELNVPQVIGITGTNGKTTTAYLLRAILEAAGRGTGFLSNIERRVGGETRPVVLNTPESTDLQRLFREMLAAGDDACVLEATSIASSKGRLEGTRFAVLVFTNLTQDHLDFHGTMENYFVAKWRLFGQAERAVINAGDEWGRRLAGEIPGAIAFDAAPDPVAAELKLRGRFNRENAVAAAAAARALGIGEDAVRRGLEAVDLVPGRFELVDEGQPFTVVVDYAHTPDALETVLGAARELAQGRVICV